MVSSTDPLIRRLGGCSSPCDNSMMSYAERLEARYLLGVGGNLVRL